MDYRMMSLVALVFSGTIFGAQEARVVLREKTSEERNTNKVTHNAKTYLSAAQGERADYNTIVFTSPKPGKKDVLDIQHAEISYVEDLKNLRGRDIVLETQRAGSTNIFTYNVDSQEAARVVHLHALLQRWQKEKIVPIIKSEERNVRVIPNISYEKIVIETIGDGKLLTDLQETTVKTHQGSFLAKGWFQSDIHIERGFTLPISLKVLRMICTIPVSTADDDKVIIGFSVNGFKQYCVSISITDAKKIGQSILRRIMLAGSLSVTAILGILYYCKK